MHNTVVKIVVLLLFIGCDASEVTDPIPMGVLQGTGSTIGYGISKEEWRGESIQLSWSPRVFVLKGFLTEEECEHLKKLVRQHVHSCVRLKCFAMY